MPDNDKSLGEQHTSDGVARDTSLQSRGAEQTLGGTVADGEAPFDDGMEVVDLSARYTIEGVLGQGGMGKVLLATDRRLERKVAIKRMLGDSATSKSTRCQAQPDRRRLTCENLARCKLRKLQHFEFGGVF